MKPNDRYEWILNYIQKKNKHFTYYRVDVLDSYFVWEYIEATNAPHSVQFFGAPKCPQLGKDLSHLYKTGKLERSPTGIGDGMSGQGFPKWVYSYKLARNVTKCNS